MKKSDVVLMVFLVFSVFLFIASRLGASNFLVVLSGSMEPTINMGDMVVTTPITSNAIKVGDIVAFNDGKEFPITHRVINITEGGFITKGDANEDPDPMVRSSSSVVGKIVFWVPFAGYLVYFARGIYGLLILIIVPGFILIISEIKNIFGYVNEDKIKKRKIGKSNRLFRSIILILSFSLLASQAIIFSSNGITGAYFSDVETGSGNFVAWIQETPSTTINKWWSDTNFTPMSDIMYNNIFYIVTKKTGEITSTNPGGFFININVSNVPATSSLTITDTITGEILPTGDFVEWPSYLHVLLDGSEITNKFDYTFDGKTLTINLKTGESIPGGNLYAWFHVKYALKGTIASVTNYPRPYTNVVSINIDGNTYSSSPAVLTGQLKKEDVEEKGEKFETPLLGGGFSGSSYQSTETIQNNSTNETLDLTSPIWSDNFINSTLAGTEVQHSVLWSDDAGLSGYIFSFDNCEDLMINDTWTPFEGNWSNVTKTINSTLGCTIKWMVYANDTSNNWNATDLFSYTTSEIIPEENTTTDVTNHYNYSDTTNNKLFYAGNKSSEQYPEISLDPFYGNEANSEQYLTTLSYESGICDNTKCVNHSDMASGYNKAVWHSFIFKINENVSDIKNINISWAGYSESNLIDSKFRVINSTGYEDVSNITNENQIYIFNITSNFENYLNSTNYIRFQVWALTDSLSDSINLWTDFVSVTVTT